ncbi:hypothetical protein FA15DRAFT_676338 [Coprinopsis marcescibilis]|uniref:DUF7137 domain-containing protein n=1 Tax=Coprinopsis marcescibilis TaxID=230819 RepID=A0A5C3KBD5_COPMA|nr:hypothetical protein FA15DRAFT_676338 [Coprinopsis marcescibilis]
MTTRRPIPQSAPAGTLEFTQPPATATSYYKVAQGNLITFGWNFTYVLAEPTSLTVSAACGRVTFPVGPDPEGLLPGAATQVVWDVHSYQMAHPETPLPQAECQLMICDERGFDSARRPGFLAPNSNLKFALYTPQPYVALADGWRCTVCSAAAGMSTHPAAISLLVTLIICFLSGFHLLRTNNHRN